MKEDINARRDFIKKVALGSAGISIGAMGFPVSSYARIMGANNRLNFGIAGLNSRGEALIKSSLAAADTSIGYVCDVDTRVLDKAQKMVQQQSSKKPRPFADFRAMLERKDLDVVAIATPDHLHVPYAIMAAQAGKNIYLEKPCSHNPYEGELLVQVQQKTGKLIQIGTQQRSAPTTLQAIKDIHGGLIGRPYFAKAWYTNARESIGTGNKAPVPQWLNWELWQGPAPRRDYQDNLVHYNWHWFRNYGTGELNNNGNHEIDICRWALGVNYPVKVSSSGGRFHFNDDWQFPDTQLVSYEFEDNKMITWEGKSCNDFQYYGRGRGATIHGTEGTVLLDRNGYQLFDLKGKLVKELKEEHSSATTNVRGEGALDIYHMNNFVDAIRKGEKLNAPAEVGATTALLCHLGNMSQQLGTSLQINPANGQVLDNPEAMKMWKREYASGWEPKV